ncbi:Thrombospondin-3 [Exaiptasia diaphana]|nr:Thrombospondin-3 [Exaiptasia diaphana]
MWRFSKTLSNMKLIILIAVVLLAIGCRALEIDLLEPIDKDPAKYGLRPYNTDKGIAFPMTLAKKLVAPLTMLESAIINIESSKEFVIYCDVMLSSSSTGALFSITHTPPTGRKTFLIDITIRGPREKSSKKPKLALKYRLLNGSTDTIIFREGIEKLYDRAYHSLALHIYDSGLKFSLVDLHIDCVMTERKQTHSPISLVFSYGGIRLKAMQFRIGQRGSRDRTSLKFKIEGWIKDLRYDFSAQVSEIKYLRKIVESCQMCRARDFCKFKPCYPGVPCFNDPYSEMGFECGDCPLGMDGNGVNCTDIDECHANPCSAITECQNRSPGYWCPPCPAGFRGKEVYGIGIRFAHTNKQVCEDINECKEGTALCSQHSKCFNTVGSYQCSPCPPGYTGDPRTACIFLDYCSSDNPRSNPCSLYADCIPKKGGRDYKCQCQTNYAGDGHFCGQDTDRDGIPDLALNCTAMECKADNCPYKSNPNQNDLDRDGRGDTCDDDIDGDGIRNEIDNCPRIPNPTQRDSDRDNLGNDCDNCPYRKNPVQGDLDQDGLGDACDSDIDGDAVPNNYDNCKSVYNPEQKDTDRDRLGDACDNCPTVKNRWQRDTDGDSLGNECDKNVDEDKDGVDDSIDNCLKVSNPGQIDNDDDGIGNKTPCCPIKK